MQKTKTGVFSDMRAVFAILPLIALLLKAPSACAEAVSRALDMCALKIIPSIFISAVLSTFLAKTSIPTYLSRLLSLPLSVIGVPRSASAAYLLGLFFGFPSGTLLLKKIYEENEISKETLNLLLPICSAPSFSFMVLGAGIGAYHSLRIGYLFYFASVISSIAVTILFKNRLKEGTNPKKQPTKPQKNLSRIFCETISDSAQSMLKICGFCAVFCVYAEAFGDILAAVLWKNEALIALFEGVFEFSSGAFAIASSDCAFNIRIVLTSFVIGFGGISLAMQNCAFFDDSSISPLRFFAVKLLISFICSIISFAFLSLLPTDIFALSALNPVYTATPPVLCGFTLVYVMIGLIIKAARK